MKKFISCSLILLGMMGVVLGQGSILQGGGGVTTPPSTYGGTPVAGNGITISQSGNQFTISTNFTVSAGAQVVTNAGNNVYSYLSVTNFFPARNVMGTNVWVAPAVSGVALEIIGAAGAATAGSSRGIGIGNSTGMAIIFQEGTSGVDDLVLTSGNASTGISIEANNGATDWLDVNYGGSSIVDAVQNFRSSQTSQLGTNGTAITFMKTATAIVNFGTINAGATSNATITVAGTVPADDATFTLGSSNFVAGIVYTAWSTNNGVFVTGFNPTAGNIVTSPGTGRATVIHP